MSGLKVSSLVGKCVFYRTELTGKWVPHGAEIKFLKFQILLTDRAQRVDGKNGVIRLVMFTQRVMVIKSSKMARFMYWIQQNISPSLGKMIKCIWKVLLGPFRKYYGLCTLELRLAKCQCLKIQDFGIFLFT